MRRQKPQPGLSGIRESIAHHRIFCQSDLRYIKAQAEKGTIIAYYLARNTKELRRVWRLVTFFRYCTAFQRDISSVGLERCLDRAEVTGSNPVYPTSFQGLSQQVQDPLQGHATGTFDQHPSRSDRIFFQMVLKCFVGPELF